MTAGIVAQAVKGFIIPTPSRSAITPLACSIAIRLFRAKCRWSDSVAGR